MKRLLVYLFLVLGLITLSSCFETGSYTSISEGYKLKKIPKEYCEASGGWIPCPDTRKDYQLKKVSKPVDYCEAPGGWVPCPKGKKTEKKKIDKKKRIAKIPKGYCEASGGWVPCPKKKKVVEVAEKPEEEFKPKNKVKDNDPPKLEVVEVLIVSDPRYVIEGKISDEGSDKIYLTADGENIPIKKGKFIINRYSPIDENIKLTATDKWGNEVSKIIKVTVNIDDNTVAKKLEPLNSFYI